jgi:hypothetical protein
MKLRFMPLLLITGGLFCIATMNSCDKNVIEAALKNDTIPHFEMEHHKGEDRDGRIQGQIYPENAKAIVTATMGTDSVSVNASGDGKFKIKDLAAGTYSLLVTPSSNNYKPKTVKNIIVRQGEDTDAGIIVLSK